ncbi:MAG: DUF58 domain-containing protein [Syntrophorhabdaceae bacterium]|nr:DUF58 domain-containing protein [Syntrophorhabdaceae bacterium]
MPRRLRMTFEGKAFLLITLAVGAAAINTGNNLLYLALCMNLSLIVVSGFLSEWTLRKVILSAQAASDAFQGIESFLAIKCSAEIKRFPSISLVLKMRFDTETVTVHFPDIPPHGTATRIAGFRPQRRGPMGSVSGTLSTLFPFSLFEKSMDAQISMDLLVYPRPIFPAFQGGSHQEAGPSETPWSAGRSGAFPRDVREHLPSDPVRDIHWKATARLEKWMVKERETEGSPFVELRVPVPCPPNEFETRLSEACGMVIDLDRREIPFLLRIGERTISRESEGRAAALAALAVARADGGEIKAKEAAP